MIYLKKNPTQIWLFEPETEKLNGLLRVDIEPKSTITEQITDPFVQLKDKNLVVCIVIHSAKLPSNIQQPVVEYVLDSKTYKTNQLASSVKGPEFLFKFDRDHLYKKIDKKQLEYLSHGTITFKVYGVKDNNQPTVFSGEKEQEFSTDVKGRAVKQVPKNVDEAPAKEQHRDRGQQAD